MRRLFVIFWVSIMLSVFLLMPVEAQQSTLSQRLQQYKELSKVTISGPEQAAISARCKSAQVIIKDYYDRALRVRISRGQLYNQQSSKLQTLINSTKNRDKNLKEFESIKNQFDSLVEVYKVKQSFFIESLQDAENIDCAKDPLGFKAIVFTIKQSQKDLIDASQEIKKFASSTMRSTLKDGVRSK